MLNINAWILILAFHAQGPIENIPFSDEASCKNAIQEVLEYWGQFTDSKPAMAVCVPFKQ
ncbi:MAG: hypothetical protein CMN56_05270 [Sneathiella sp.]|nr:hypothetical protein [Sneathiella sp.]|tara:strand:- start:883 stop:1062 length:180 start_codon:yes stop_codon:yes gene_type:complete